MKTMIGLFVVMLSCFGLVLQLQADPPVACDITVVGLDSPGADVPAVSAAVNGPHSSANVAVCLEGTFDFGTGTVLIDPLHADPQQSVHELNIVGLENGGGNKATIKNGVQSFRFIATSALPVLRIKNIRFEGPLFTAISIFRGNEFIEISGNEIHVANTFSDPTVFGGLPFREGITLTTAFTSIGGRVLIARNTVDGGAYDPLNPLDVNMVNFGIGVIGPVPSGANQVTAEVIIRDNILKNWSGSSILVQGLEPVTVIENNVIEPGPFANMTISPGGTGCVATGIVLLDVNDDIVSGNKIHKVALTAGNTAPVCTAGIALVAGCNADQTNCFDSNNNLFRSNRITGSGTHAINLVGTNVAAFPNPGPLEHNVFLGNNLTGFAASVASVGLSTGASQNIFVGNSGTVTGNVDANTITGLTPVAGDVGEGVSGAVSNN